MSNFTWTLSVSRFACLITVCPLRPASDGVTLLLSRLWLVLVLLQPVAILLGKDGVEGNNQAHSTAKKPLAVAICYTKGKRVFVLQPGSAKAIEWTSAKELYLPALSPQGTSVAYTLSVPSKTQLSGSRYIAVVDTPGGRPRIVYGTQDHHCFAPVWSPDGEMIAFNNLQKDKWGISVINKDGSNQRDILFDDKPNSGVYVVEWSKDCRSVFGIDFDYLYQADLNGNLIKKTPLKDVGLYVTSSGGSYSLCPDGNRLLLGIGSDFIDVEDEGYPGSVVFLLDLPSGKARRITPEGMLATQPAWLPDGNSFLFRAAGKKVKPGIYRMTLDSKKCELVVAEARNPSAARR